MLTERVINMISEEDGLINGYQRTKLFIELPVDSVEKIELLDIKTNKAPPVVVTNKGVSDGIEGHPYKHVLLILEPYQGGAGDLKVIINEYISRNFIHIPYGVEDDEDNGEQVDQDRYEEDGNSSNVIIDQNEPTPVYVAPATVSYADVTLNFQHVDGNDLSGALIDIYITSPDKGEAGKIEENDLLFPHLTISSKYTNPELANVILGPSQGIAVRMVSGNQVNVRCVALEIKDPEIVEAGRLKKHFMDGSPNLSLTPFSFNKGYRRTEGTIVIANTTRQEGKVNIKVGKTDHEICVYDNQNVPNKNCIFVERVNLTSDCSIKVNCSDNITVAYIGKVYTASKD